MPQTTKPQPSGCSEPRRRAGLFLMFRFGRVGTKKIGPANGGAVFEKAQGPPCCRSVQYSDY